MIDPKKQLTIEEVREFFSATKEYVIHDKGENIELVLLAKNNSSTLLYKECLNIQQLIRAIDTLRFNSINKI